jgi:hypothetical protein
LEIELRYFFFLSIGFFADFKNDLNNLAP